MKTYFFLLLSFTGLYQTALAQCSDVVNFTARTNEFSEIDEIEVSDISEVFVAGRFLDTLTIGNFEFINTADNIYWDVFLSKIDGNGQPVWVKHIYCGLQGRVTDLTSDEDGNIYMSGKLSGEYDFIDENSSNASGFGNVGFIVKYTSAGELGWIEIFESNREVDVTGIEYSNENIYFTGNIDNGSQGMILGNDTIDQSDMFYLGKMSVEGDILWARGVEGSKEFYENVQAIAVDDIGSVYIGGHIEGAAVFHPERQPNVTSTSTRLFLAKYSAEGNFGWLETGYLGGEIQKQDKFSDIDISSSNDIYMIGRYYSGSFPELGTSFGGVDSWSYNYCQGFLMKSDSSGTLEWSRQLRGDGFQFPMALSLNEIDATVTIAGSFAKEVTIDGTKYYSGYTGTLGSIVDVLFDATLDFDGNILGFNKANRGFTTANDIEISNGNTFMGGATPGDFTYKELSLGSDDIDATEGMLISTCNNPSDPIGLDENIAQSNVVVWPNPSAGVYYLEDPVEWEVFDYVGNKTLSGFSNEIDLLGQPSGIYFLKLGGRSTKLIKS